MKSYPKVAKILEVKKNNTVRVHFLGDYTTGTVKIADIGLIGENTALIQLNLFLKKKRLDYAKAVRELERLQSVAGHALLFQN